MQGAIVLRATALLLLGTALPTYAAKPPELLPRTGKWLVDYADASCILAVKFGTGENDVLLRFDRIRPGDQQEVVVVSNRFRTQDLSTRVRVAFEPGPPAETVDTLNGTIGQVPFMRLGSLRLDGLRSGIDVSSPEIGPVREAAVERMTITRAGRTIALDLRGIAPAMKALRACTDDLVRSWGYDPAAEQTFSRKLEPATSPSGWIGSEDYPSTALALGQSAVLQIRLDVDPQGRVIDCTILSQTKNEAFGSVTCNALRRRGRFKPALDAAGKPVKMYWTGGFLYRVR